MGKTARRRGSSRVYRYLVGLFFWSEASIAMATEDALSRWWTKETVAVVTGSNRGIGLEIARQLSSKGLSVVLTSRDINSGLTAVKQLKQEGLEVAFHGLDISDQDSVDKFFSWLKEQYQDGIDILINNAGVLTASEENKLQRAKHVINTNYYGTKRMIEASIPMMKHSSAGARIINLSSVGSRLDLINNSWKEQLNSVEELTEKEIDTFIGAFLDAVSKDEIAKQGWPELSYADYSISKMALNAYARITARNLSLRPIGEIISMNCMCPGRTSSGMSPNRGHPVAVGADTAVWLALLPSSLLTSGKFFVKRTEVDFFQVPLYAADQLFYSLTDMETFVKSKQ